MPRRLIKKIRYIKANVRHELNKPHRYLCRQFTWYDWWHRQDIHRHIHYAAMICGLIAAIYYVMIDEILSRVNL
ncbi:MAG: hypothetical protein WC570_03315 [Patescibacteria group bacterium]